MEATIAMINAFKLKQGKFCSRFFNYCADQWVPQEAIFYLAAERYIFEKDQSLVRVFTDVLWQKAGDLSLNLMYQDLSVLRRMISAPEVKVNQGTAKHTNLVNRGGLGQGAAGDYNMMTRAIEYCTLHVSQSTTVAAQRMLQDGKELPNEANLQARNAAKQYVDWHIVPILGQNALKKLGVFH